MEPKGAKKRPTFTQKEGKGSPRRPKGNPMGLWIAKWGPKGAQREPNGTNREPKRHPREPKGARDVKNWTKKTRERAKRNRRRHKSKQKDISGNQKVQFWIVFSKFMF